MTETAPTRRSFLDRQRDAALATLTEQQTEFRRIADIVLPERPGAPRRPGRRVTDVIRLGDDHLVQVTERKSADRDEALWTFVVGGKASNDYHHTQEDAILHLIATRYDPNPNSSINAAFYAGRLLGIPGN